GRLRLHVDASGVIGLHARGTHAVVPIRGCVVSDPALSRGIAALRAVGAEHLAELDAVELRVGGPGEPLLAVLSPRGPRGLSPMARRAFAAIGPKVRATEPSDPDPPLHHLPLPGGTYLAVPPRVFAQVNWAVNLALVTRVVEGALAASASRFCDAYAGAGNFTIPLVARGLRGVSLEVDGAAVEAARGALVTQGLPSDGLRAVDAATGLAELARHGEQFDLAVVDPPRAGAREAIAPLLALAPRVIALGSCDPPTFARDLAALVAGGYRVTSVEGFDMFPMTHHVEALAFLERGDARGAG
ncbi:MAG: class I SAM-dependent RNA methyltransferase, partial [Deltaproteobacteria bacterium]|nr:class I SAM-dependent RNA methyltransferase [Deltaproteobacteria bacterium]